MFGLRAAGKRLRLTAVGLVGAGLLGLSASACSEGWDDWHVAGDLAVGHDAYAARFLSRDDWDSWDLVRLAAADRYGVAAAIGAEPCEAAYAEAVTAGAAVGYVEWGESASSVRISYWVLDADIAPDVAGVLRALGCEADDDRIATDVGAVRDLAIRRHAAVLAEW